MKKFLLPVLALGLAGAQLTACNDFEPQSRAYPISDRSQIIGGESALADLGDFVLENDQIRIALPKQGNSVGPGVFGGSLIDADLNRHQPRFRAGRGMDQFTELFSVGNLSIPAICEADDNKHEDFCQVPSQGIKASVRVLCDGSRPCVICNDRRDCATREGQIDLSDPVNADYADPDDPSRVGPDAPSERAAIIRVEGMSGNYLEALNLVSLANVKSVFRVRNDFILEPGVNYVRIRTLLTEALANGSVRNPDGEVLRLPPMQGPIALFGLLLGSANFPTELPNLLPGVAGGDFLFFGDRLSLFAPGIGFDVYKDIRVKFATGLDPLNNPVAADFLSGVGQNVSYAIGAGEAGGKYLLPIFSGAVTAGFTHGAYCFAGTCPGTEQECRQVVDCSGVRSFVFERVFAVGEGDVASAAEAILRLRGDPLGRLSGRVVDGKNSRPVSLADVFVYPVPETMADCRRDGDPAEAYRHGPEGFLSECLQRRGFDGSVNHMRTDKEADAPEQGRFDGWLPTGRYYLLAKSAYRPASRVVAVSVTQDGHSKVTLQLMPPAKLRFEILDAKNQRVPAKLTVGQCLPNCSGRYEGICETDADCAEGSCAPLAGGQKRCLVDNCPEGRRCNLSAMRCEAVEACASDADCGLMEGCQQGRCVCRASFKRQAALAEGSYKPGMARYSYTADGVGEVELVPGAYDVWASRGFEYSVDKQQVQLISGRTEELVFRIAQVVDTEGWLSGDFHVHGQNSYDAVVKHRDRVMNFAGEGVDILSTSDHDYITDLSPYLKELGLENWLSTQVGLELTTIEVGHWLAFPLRYKEFENGERVREQGAVDWTGKVPEQIHAELRELGEFGPEETVVVVAHPRDSFFGYFDQFGMNHYNPSEIKGSLFETFPGMENPLAAPDEFSGTFDALELFNSKRFEMIRTPSAGEIRDYNQARAIIQDQGRLGMSADEIEAQLVILDQQFIKELLTRSPAEQDAIWEADGSAKCDLKPFCVSDDDCDAGQVCEPAEMLCIRPCSTDEDCAGAACSDGRCDPGWTPYGEPCTSFEGMVDEWFRLIDYGVVRTGMGNSDTHQLFTQTEGGCPRNFVRSKSERGLGVDRLELARSIKSGKLVASYGPFVEAWLGNAGIGETLEPASGMSSIPLRIRVQSPGWFDVDRVEVYRSGRLVHVFTGEGDELDPDSQVDVSGLRLPNRSVVNLDVTVEEPVPEQDSWYVIIAMGLHGRDLSPVYSEHPYLKLQIGDILSRSFNSVPLMASLGIDLAGIPRVFRVYPYAVANPIFVDVDGGGYDSPNPKPAWADGSLTSQTQGLSSPLAPATDARSYQQQQLRYFMALMHRAFEGL